MMYPYPLHILIFNIFDILKKGLSFLSYFDLFLGPIEDDLGTNFESTTCIVFLLYRLTTFVLTLSVMGYLTVIISWGGGLKDPQPKTGLNLVQSLCQSYHVTRSLAWPITQKMRSLALKMKKLWAFHFLRKSWNLQESVKFIKEKLGGAIFKTPPFGARCTNLTQFFFKSCVFTK